MLFVCVWFHWRRGWNRNDKRTIFIFQMTNNSKNTKQKKEKHSTKKKKLHLNDTGKTFRSIEEDELYLSLGSVRRKHLSSLIEACCGNGHQMTQGTELGFKLSSLGQWSHPSHGRLPGSQLSASLSWQARSYKERKRKCFGLPPGNTPLLGQWKTAAWAEVTCSRTYHTGLGSEVSCTAWDIQFTYFGL